VGRPLLPEILGQISDRLGAKSPIFDLFSLVAPQRKSSINTIGSPLRAFQWALHSRAEVCNSARHMSNRSSCCYHKWCTFRRGSSYRYLLRSRVWHAENIFFIRTTGIKVRCQRSLLCYLYAEYIRQCTYRRSRLNGGPGLARLMGPIIPMAHVRGGMGAVLCTCESRNTHLGPNQGQTVPTAREPEYLTFAFDCLDRDKRVTAGAACRYSHQYKDLLQSALPMRLSNCNSSFPPFNERCCTAVRALVARLGSLSGPPPTRRLPADCGVALWALCIWQPGMCCLMSVWRRERDRIVFQLVDKAHECVVVICGDLKA